MKISSSVLRQNPNEAIQDPDRPVIDPDEPEVSETENTYLSFAYEDIWPSGGDYDLNDVIIEYIVLLPSIKTIT